MYWRCTHPYKDRSLLLGHARSRSNSASSHATTGWRSSAASAPIFRAKAFSMQQGSALRQRQTPAGDGRCHHRRNSRARPQSPDRARIELGTVFLGGRRSRHRGEHARQVERHLGLTLRRPRSGRTSTVPSAATTPWHGSRRARCTPLGHFPLPSRAWTWRRYWSGLEGNSSHHSSDHAARTRRGFLSASAG